MAVIVTGCCSLHARLCLNSSYAVSRPEIRQLQEHASNGESDDRPASITALSFRHTALLPPAQVSRLSESDL